MAITFKYHCQTCNTDLGTDGNLVLSHLSSNPTHVVDHVIIDDATGFSEKPGATQTYNGEPYYYDTNLSLWVSLGKNNIFWGTPANNQNNAYLRLAGSMTPVSTDTGYVITEPSVITKISANNRSSDTSATYQIREYGGTVLGSINVPNGQNLAYNNSASITLPYPATVSCYLSSTGNTDYPQCSVEVRSYIP